MNFSQVYLLVSCQSKVILSWEERKWSHKIFTPHVPKEDKCLLFKISIENPSQSGTHFSVSAFVIHLPKEKGKSKSLAPLQEQCYKVTMLQINIVLYKIVRI